MMILLLCSTSPSILFVLDRIWAFQAHHGKRRHRLSFPGITRAKQPYFFSRRQTRVPVHDPALPIHFGSAKHATSSCKIFFRSFIFLIFCCRSWAASASKRWRSLYSKLAFRRANFFFLSSSRRHHALYSFRRRATIFLAFF